MDWIKNLNQVIDYIENNLTGEIVNDEIVKLAGCSIYNFQRMFSYIADKPLSEYIRSRKLTLAAFDIINSRERIIDIALKYGYESQDSFARAFKHFHGVLPSTARNQTVQLKSCPKISFQITVKGANDMNYQIEQWPAFKIAGIRKHISTADAFQIIPQIWDTAWKDGTMSKLLELFQKADYRPAGFIGMAIGGQWGNSEEMDYCIGVTNYVDHPSCNYVPVPEGMEEMDLPQATWVIFNADGELPDAVQKIYKQFYMEWLPNSGYQLEDLPAIETFMQDNRQEVWIAVKQK